MNLATPRPKQAFHATLLQVSNAVEGELVSNKPEEELFAVTTDSRDIPPNSLFIALEGDNFDGHNFINIAAEKGATAAVVRKSAAANISSKGLSLIIVDDTLVSLGKLARWHRDQFEIPVIGLSGSTGKSSTKELIASLLSDGHNVLKTTGNLNNLIGVPLTLFSLSPDHDVAVIEAGISFPGEMERLTTIIRPTIRLVLNAGLSHVEYLGDIAGVAKEKARLFDQASNKDTLIYNADDPFITKEVKKRTMGQKISFALDSLADITGKNIESLGANGSRFELSHKGSTEPVHITSAGRHQVYNACAAAAVAIALGITLKEIAAALSQEIDVMPGRSQISTLANNIALIDDTYNSNPDSALAAIDLLASMDAQRRVAILADMLELGSQGPNAHRQIGQIVVAKKIDHLITYGDLSKFTSDAALEAGMSPKQIKHCSSQEEACLNASTLIQKGDVVLVKGSRGMKMEKVVEAIKGGKNTK